MRVYITWISVIFCSGLVLANTLECTSLKKIYKLIYGELMRKPMLFPVQMKFEHPFDISGFDHTKVSLGKDKSSFNHIRN